MNLPHTHTQSFTYEGEIQWNVNTKINQKTTI